jgi:glyoxylase-like metal-dependent hydrolase (beta-lactamase superfamily II)
MMITRRARSAPVLLTALIATLVATPLSGQRSSREPRIEVDRLAEGVYLMRAPSEMDQWTSSNSLVVVGTTGVLVFDSNALPSTTRKVLAEIRAITNLPVRLLVNSHWHMDHWSGNEVYADAFPGLEIIASARTRSIMERMPNPFFVESVGVEVARARLQDAVASGTLSDGAPATGAALEELRADLETREALASSVRGVRRVLPSTVFTDSLAFMFDGWELRLYEMTGDAAGSTVLHLPGEGLLATGDVLVRQEDGRGAQPWTMNSFAVSEWLESLRRLEAFDAAIIVPGQGPAMRDAEYLHATKELYQSLIDQTDAALRSGALQLADIRNRIDVTTFHSRFSLDSPELEAAFEAVVASLVRRIVQEMRDGVAPRS